jgi:uncharacterized protein (DUF488 family)
MFTIGHSNHSIEDFVALLEQHAVDCVCDVRSAPYSRRNPQFNRETLKATLSERDITYVWLGRELGARTEDETCYINGRVSFDRLSQADLFLAGIDRLLEGDKRFTIAMMCAEKEPLNCHRTILVTKHLSDLDVPVIHILADGRLERHEETIDRLIDLVGLEREDLFASYEEIVGRAYRLREQDIASGTRS